MKVLGLNHEFAYVRCTTRHLKEMQFTMKCKIKLITNLNSYTSLIVLWD